MEYIQKTLDVPVPVLAFYLTISLIGLLISLYSAVYVLAPVPRPPKLSEKSFQYVGADGKVNTNVKLPCWIDRHAADKEALHLSGDKSTSLSIEPAEVLISVVVPAYNEQERLGTMLTEAVEYLQEHFSDQSNGKKVANGSASSSQTPPTGFEILIISDGSTDATIETALEFAKSSTCRSKIRVVALTQNRGKGGAVTHGLRHVRGQYIIFADADGASRFSDLGSLLKSCKQIQARGTDRHQKAIAVGSRNHLVGSEAVVKRSFSRNLLMHGFHLFLKLLTPPKTAKIRDTQCGFKLFSRSALPDIVPYMHSEGWIFDVEMLMLAESAGIEVAEVPVAWHEVTGSKLNVIKDSLAMAWGLAILRLAWGIGVYKRT